LTEHEKNLLHIRRDNFENARIVTSFFLPARRSKVGYMLRQRGSLADWLCVTRRYCIKPAKPILKLFRPSGSPISLVSSAPCADTQLQGHF